MQNTCVESHILQNLKVWKPWKYLILVLNIQLQNHQLQKLSGLGINSVGFFSPSNIISFYFQAFGLIIISSGYADGISSDYVYLCNESWSLGVFDNETTC